MKSALVDTFGRMGGTLFIPTADPAQITHWQAPSTIAGRTLDVTITRTSDDTPSAVEPEGATVATFNDNAMPWSKTVRIIAHQHQWTPTSPIDVAPLSVSDNRPEKGTIIALTYHGAEDIDHWSVSTSSGALRRPRLRFGDHPGQAV